MEWWDLTKTVGAIAAGSVPVVIGIHDFLAYRTFKRQKNELEILKLRLETHELNERLGDPFAEKSTVRVTRMERDPNKPVRDIDKAVEEEFLRAWRERKERGDPRLISYRETSTRRLYLNIPLSLAFSITLLWAAVANWNFAIQQWFTSPLVILSFFLGGMGLAVLQVLAFSSMVLEERRKAEKNEG